jgi:hypothetical protein
VTLRVFRATGTPSQYLVVAEGGDLRSIPASSGLHTFATQIPVRAGDIIGVRGEVGACASQTGNSQDTYGVRGGTATPVGSSNTYTTSNAGFKWDISATLEADADCDGFGDETQDSSVDPNGCNPPAGQPSADGTLTIDANKGKVEKGRKVTLTGQLDVAANEACEPGRAIQVQRRLKSEDDSKFETFKTVQTDATGNFSLRQKVKKTYFYRAVVSETDACDDETSNSQKVRVQKKKAAQEA